jgi:hypothetical protein
MRLSHLNRIVARFTLTLGIVLLPLRTAAATIPMLFADDVAVGRTTTKIHDAVRSEGEARRISAYDCDALALRAGTR